MSDWQVGDLAVCVDDKDFDGSKMEIIKGRIYRVQDVFVGCEYRGGPCDVVALDVGVIGSDGQAGFDAACFRPILPAEPAFTEAMRSLRPKVEA